jgi:hypothetical protein
MVVHLSASRMPRKFDKHVRPERRLRKYEQFLLVQGPARWLTRQTAVAAVAVRLALAGVQAVAVVGSALPAIHRHYRIERKDNSPEDYRSSTNSAAVRGRLLLAAGNYCPRTAQARPLPMVGNYRPAARPHLVGDNHSQPAVVRNNRSRDGTASRILSVV